MSIMDDYAKTMRTVHMDDESRAQLKERLRKEALQTEPTSTRSLPGVGTYHHSAAHHNLQIQQPVREAHAAARTGAHTHGRRRVLAIAACSTLAIVGVAGALALGPQLLGSLGASPAASVSAPSFVLAAYAEGTPVPDRSNTVLTGGEFLTYVPGWDAGYSDDDDTTVHAHFGFIIDLTTLGKDITSVTYTIDGDDSAYFEYGQSRYGVQMGDALADRMSQTITLSSEELAAIGTIEGGSLSLEMSCDLPKSFNELCDARLSSHNSQNGNDDFYYQSITYGASLLSGRTLSITATFEDGSELTHAYRLEPVENFEEQLRANTEAVDESIANSTNPSELDLEPLFMLEQIQ